MAVLLAIDLVRGGRGEQEGGEDVDLSHGSDWRTIGLLVGAFVANALLIERVGWPISGAILFFGTTYALGSRHYIRNAIISSCCPSAPGTSSTSASASSCPSGS